MQLAEVTRYLLELGVPEMSRTERGALPRVLRAAVMEDERNRRRLDRLSVLVALSTAGNFATAVWVALHR